MVPLDPAAARHVRARLGLPEGPGLLALRHALAYRRPGLWGDDPVTPRSVVLVREGDGRIEAFGAGEPWPALGWLAGHGRPFSLHAPDDWLATVDAMGEETERTEVETWSLESPAPIDEGSDENVARARPPRVAVRRLWPDDREGFLAAAPPWALRGWQSYPALVEHGAAFGVPHGPGFAALAWVFDQADVYDAVGLHTAPRFRRLGLGRAAASALVTDILERRGKVPLWSFPPGHLTSRALAASLGFTFAASEPVLHRPPRGE